MNILRSLIFLLLLCTGVTVNSQTALIESLRSRLHNAQTDDERLAAYLYLFEEHQSLNRDSMDIYGPEVQALAQKSNNSRYKSLAVLAYANWYFRWGWSDSALSFIEPELSNNKLADDNTRDIYFKLSRAKAIYHGSKSRYEEALTVLYKILPEAEKYKDTLNIGLASNSIGSIAIARQQYQEAFQWINKAIAAAGNNEKYVQVLAPALLNKGYAYVSQDKTDSALFFINKGLLLSRELQNLNYVATALRLQATAYTAVAKYGEAEKALLEMIAVRKSTSPANQMVDDNLQLAEFYANSGQIKKAIELCRKNLAQGDLTIGTAEGVYANDPKIRLEYLQVLSGYYKKAGMMPEYQLTLEQLLITKDSFYAANSAEAIAELQTRYEVQKKENTILQQKYGLQRKNFLLYGYIILSAILLVSGIALFINYRKRQRQQVQQMMEEEKRQAIEAVKNAEEKERVRIASDLHDNLGAYAASMASNLSYIHLPEVDSNTKIAFRELSHNSNAIISQLNDTIWVLKKDSLNLTAISDRIKIFISRIRNSYPGMQIEVEEDISIDHLLSSPQAFHLYRILQEGINNALKHSKGKNITIRFNAADTWKVVVEDDGEGMAIDTTGKTAGNGLQHIRDRSREAGWAISWRKAEPKGTLMQVSPTTN